MKQIAFCFIFSILFFNIVQSKKYLVEVDGEKGDSSEEQPASSEEDETIESDGIFCSVHWTHVHITQINIISL